MEKPAEKNTGAGALEGWTVVPADEGSMERLASEPRTTVELSPAQERQRQAAIRAASDDPAAYLRDCRAD